VFFFSSRRRHTRFDCDWSSDVCSSDLDGTAALADAEQGDAVGVGEGGGAVGVGADVVAFDDVAGGAAAGDVNAVLRIAADDVARSEERRVGKECRCGWAVEHY